MATLTYNVVSEPWSWSANVTINFTTSYDPATNQTTFTFGDCVYYYFGRKGYGTSIYTEIWVSADWDSNTAVATTLSISSSTNGGGKTFTGTPSPSTLTVQHASTPGNKIGVCSSTTKIGVYPASNATKLYYFTGSGEGNVLSTTLYTFHKHISGGVDVNTITNTSNGYIQLEEGSLIHAGSVLQMWRSAKDGYTLTEAHFGGGGVLENGATHTVTGDTTVTITASVNRYSLTINPSTGSIITVNRTSSPLQGAATGSISSGDTIYYNDVLKITFDASPGYKIDTHTVNDVIFTSGDSHTVTSAVTVVATASLNGIAHLYANSEYVSSLCWIYANGQWYSCIPYLYNGGKWNICV